MKKRIQIVIIAIICVLCGCSSEPEHLNEYEYVESFEDRYDKGYEDGYECGYDNGFLEGFNEADCTDELLSYKNIIVSLVYDHEYGVVEKLMDYYPEGVENALEVEFGVNDLTIIIDYLEERSQTIVGVCEICGKMVYADEIAVLPSDIDCAHEECISGDINTSPLRINKTP